MCRRCRHFLTLASSDVYDGRVCNVSRVLLVHSIYTENMHTRVFVFVALATTQTLEIRNRARFIENKSTIGEAVAVL